VELLIKTRSFHSADDFAETIDAFAAKHGLPDRASRPPVRLLASELPLRSLPRLYAAADAFVLPSRGEGWGRPHVEAMAMGLPVLATNWSGPAAYLSEATGYPLPYELAPVADELRLPGHRWAEPSVSALRATMREVVASPDEARRRGGAARQLMRGAFSPGALGEELAGHLARIGQQLHAAGR
jgi:glycosyltransferase involved in cell wall biosynthesis